MNKYKVSVPFQHDMGSIDTFIVSETPMESKEEQALWQINSMRRHDSLGELLELPEGTKFTPKAFTAIALGLCLLFAPSLALAECTSYQANINGKFVTCWSCCVGGYCNVNCN